MPSGPPTDQVVRLWRNADETWRWRWDGPDEQLTSNEAYLNRDEAVQAAGIAFPGVMIHQDEPPEGVVLPTPLHRPGLGTRLLDAGILVTLFVLGRRGGDAAGTPDGRTRAAGKRRS